MIHLSRHSNRPLYLQVADQLRRQIELGELAPHSRLPASRALAKNLSVNRITVVNAYAELEAEGLVISRVGSGTFVAESDIVSTTPALPLQPMASAPRRPWTSNQMVAEMMRLARQPEIISFAGGAPAAEFFPVNDFRRALNEVLRRDGAICLQYEAVEGYYPLRQSIAQQLQQEGIPVQAEDVLITAGCQQAVDIALYALASHEQSTIFAVDPCYLGLLNIAHTRRVNVVGLPWDTNGLCLGQLGAQISQHQPQLLYLTPTFHNPTGVTMPLTRRQHLLNLTQSHAVPVLEDTSYNALHYDGPTVPSLKSIAPDQVLLAGSFSKTLMPGIRIGYLVAPPLLRERVINLKQTMDILTSPLNQRALHLYLSNGDFEGHLARVRTAYRERRDVMLQALHKHLPGDAQWSCPDGGIYLWVNMPEDGPYATDLYLMAVKHGVAFSIGSLFSVSGRFWRAIRLNFADHTPDEIEEGIRRLGKAWQMLLQGHTAQPDFPASVLL